MSSVLVPFDGSSSALRAIEHAAQQARPARRTLHLLNVQQPLDDYGMVAAYLSKKQHHAIVAACGKDTLGPAIKRLQRGRVAHAAHVLVDANIAEAIVRTARRLRCDAIIMGTRGMTELGNLIMGSVASRVIHLAAVPVTLVK